MDLFERRYKKSDSIVFRKIADEFILVPIRKSAADLDSIYTLNEVAAKIWEAIDGNKSLYDIKLMILDEYEVDENKVEEDIKELILQLEEIEAVKLES